MGANPKGYNFPVDVTKGHECEAMETQQLKKRSRVGKLVLKVMGFKREVGCDYVELGPSPSLIGAPTAGV